MLFSKEPKIAICNRSVLVVLYYLKKLIKERTAFFAELIFSQQFAFQDNENFEVILVDDGSKGKEAHKYWDLIQPYFN